MIDVLIVTREPRLVEAVKSNLDGRAEVRVAATVEDAYRVVFQESIRLAFLDYDLVAQAQPELIIGIDSVLVKEQAPAVLLCRQATPAAVQFRDQFNAIRVAIDLSRGREPFDEKVREVWQHVARLDPSVTTDGLVRVEVDLPAPESGSLVDFPLARLLYTLWQRKESGRLKLRYANHELLFGFRAGELIVSGQFGSRSDLLGAFAWSHGSYDFEHAETTGSTIGVMSLIAEGCRDHIRQRAITEMMTPLMRRYPVPTSLWEERADHLHDYPVLMEVMASLDGMTNWEKALSALGQRVTDGFRAAYFAVQLDLVHTVQETGMQGVTVQYSREVRRARQAVDRAEVEKTKAFQASSSTGASQIETELGVRLGQMRHMTPYELFGVWEGCGKRVVQDRFYALVKEHHPDVYGGNTSGNVRSLAQDIFILIKNAHQELLSVEREQTVAEPAAQKQRPSRAPHETPRLTRDSEAADDGSEPVDVRAKMAQLSGFRKRQRQRQRLASLSGESAASDSEVSDSAHHSDAQIEEAPEPEPEIDEAAERQAKLDHLLKRAQKAGHPNAQPAKDAFDKGFHALKEGRKRDALEHFTKAHQLEPEDGSYLTFYGYTKFLNDPAAAPEAEELLRTALQTGNRQSAPDACLFLGHVLKGLGREEEALGFYRRALRLNPTSHEAEREIRLAEKRSGRKDSDPGNVLKNLFKK